MPRIALSESLAFCLFAPLLVLPVGCSRRPAAVPLPELNVSAAADMAVSEADNDGDGQLSTAELAKYPALAGAMGEWDADSSGKLSAEEIQKQLQMWRDQGAAIRTVRCSVTMNGRGLEGANVEFIPEPFMGDGIKPASGITGQNGLLLPSLSKKDLPKDLQSFTGMHLGIYKVRITHPSKKIASEFNTNTTLGAVVGPSTLEVVLAVK
ncbi:MAG: hypothetical protein ACR2NU_04385 [Aeoliella sp.]